MGTPFGDSVLGGNDELVRNAIRSSNYGVDADGVIRGWSINRDGSAEFHDVTIGNSAYSVDEMGVATFSGVVINGDNASIVLNGVTLQDILDSRPKGRIANAWLDVDGAITSGTTEIAIMELLCELEDGRSYRIGTSNFIVNGTVLDDVFRVNLRDGGAASPSTSSNLLCQVAVHIFNTAVIPPGKIDFTFQCDTTQPASIHNLTPGTHRMLLTMFRHTGTGVGQIDTGGGVANPLALYLEDVGPSKPNTAVNQSGSGGGTNPVQQYVKTYYADWGCSYRGAGATCGSDFSRFNQNGVLYQGRYSSCNADTRSWIGFDYTQIQTDLSGATVNKCEVFLKYTHWYYNSGGTAVIGTHNSSFVGSGDTGPGFNESLDNTDRVRSSGWAIGASKWVNLGTTIGNEFKAGTTKGIVIGSAPDAGNLIYYGQAVDSNTSGQPALRLTYTK